MTKKLEWPMLARLPGKGQKVVLVRIDYFATRLECNNAATAQLISRGYFAEDVAPFLTEEDANP